MLRLAWINELEELAVAVASLAASSVAYLMLSTDRGKVGPRSKTLGKGTVTTKGCFCCVHTVSSQEARCNANTYGLNNSPREGAPVGLLIEESRQEVPDPITVLHCSISEDHHVQVLEPSGEAMEDVALHEQYGLVLGRILQVCVVKDVGKDK